MQIMPPVLMPIWMVIVMVVGLLLVTAWLGVIALQAGLLWTLWSGPYGSPTRFGRLVSRTLGLSALAATVWTPAPVATLPLPVWSWPASSLPAKSKPVP